MAKTSTSFSRTNPRPGPGRPRGVPNKATTEVRTWAQEVLGDPKVRAKTLSLARSGRLAPAIHVSLLHYAYGKPAETVELQGGLSVGSVTERLVAARKRLRREA